MTNPYTLIAGFFIVDAIAIGTLGYLPPATVAFVLGLVVWNFCQVGGQTGINNLATLSYPPEMRSSGIGWAGGMGGGDVKLGTAIGLWFAPLATLIFFVATSFAGGFVLRRFESFTGAEVRTLPALSVATARRS